MGVWNAIECWFLQRLVLGISSSVGTLALSLRPLYSNISLLSFLLSWGIPILTVQECQSYSQFHNRNYLSQIWQRAFARFLILPGELHLGGPKPNCRESSSETVVQIRILFGMTVDQVLRKKVMLAWDVCKPWAPPYLIPFLDAGHFHFNHLPFLPRPLFRLNKDLKQLIWLKICQMNLKRSRSIKTTL